MNPVKPLYAHVYKSSASLKARHKSEKVVTRTESRVQKGEFVRITREGMWFSVRTLVFAEACKMIAEQETPMELHLFAVPGSQQRVASVHRSSDAVESSSSGGRRKEPLCFSAPQHASLANFINQVICSVVIGCAESSCTFRRSRTIIGRLNNFRDSIRRTFYPGV